MAFPGTIQGQLKTLAFFSVIGQDNTYSNHGYMVINFQQDFDTSMVAADSVQLGAYTNPYAGDVYFRHVMLQTGFAVFTGATDIHILCLSDCYIGQVTSGNERCFLCDPTTSLDTAAWQCLSKCPTNQYPSPLTTSYRVCIDCNDGPGYYVNLNDQCIPAQCPNGFMESGEGCDDGNSNDGGTPKHVH